MSAYVWIVRFPEDLSAEDFLEHYKTNFTNDYKNLKTFHQERGQDNGHVEEIMKTFKAIKENVIFDIEGIAFGVTVNLISYLEKKGYLIYTGYISKWTNVVVNLTVLEKEAP